jgi:glycosyltransferase involved in cell wall biosynthesis
MTRVTPDLSLVLACYNEEPILERSVGEIFRVLDALRWTSEVIFVDDASRDRTSGIIDRILRDNPKRQLRKIEHVQNVGRGGTVSDGIRAAGGRFVGFIDVDLEVHARYILPCLLALERGYDVATGLRIYKLHFGSFHRYVMSRGYRTLLRWRLDVPLEDTETGCKFFRRDRILPVLDQVLDQGWFWDTEIMVQAHLAGLRIVEIPALFERCIDKPSSVKLVRDSLLHFQKLRQFSRAVGEMKNRARK